MPYYCTVPRCTSMAGKAKNVSFHQFPRDVGLAELWNSILKRGKPYTKYSKVCSLHFKPEDYTITNVGKNKGQWRTLRKDAIPSQNLPSESPNLDNPKQRRQTGNWERSYTPPAMVDPLVQQQMAQAIYVQTMLALQAAGTTDNNSTPSTETAHTSTETDTDFTHRYKAESPIECDTESSHEIGNDAEMRLPTSYKCLECSKCFKDPDVFKLHKRTHGNNNPKELNGNKDSNDDSQEKSKETLRSNPILANLLKSEDNLDDSINMENQIINTLACLRNIASFLIQNKNEDSDSNHDSLNSNHDSQNSNRDSQNFNHDSPNSNRDSPNLNHDSQNCIQDSENCTSDRPDSEDCNRESQNSDHVSQNCVSQNSTPGSHKCTPDSEDRNHPNCNCALLAIQVQMGANTNIDFIENKNDLDSHHDSQNNHDSNLDSNDQYL